MAVSPTRAQAFLASLGFDTHIAYTDGGYANVANLEADMAYLGITNIRDGISNGANGSAPIASYINLAQHGAKFTFIVGASGGTYTTATLQSQLTMFDQINEAVPGSVVAIEGPNEINNQPLTYNGVSGEQGAINLQRDLYAMVHADANLAGVGVDYFTGYNTYGNAAGPNPSATPGLADFDTQHPYPNFNQAPAYWVNPANTLGNETAPFGPFVYTETGYSTNAVNQDVQARYSLDLFLDAAEDGSSKTFLYQLLDAYQPGSYQGDDGYGLFDPSGAPKLAAIGIHNLTAILADTGATAATFTPTAINYSVAGLPSTGSSMALAKSDGTQDIAVWAEPSIANSQTGAESSIPTESITVALGGTYGTVNVYDPLIGTTPIATYQNVSSVPLTIGASPVIVEVKPQPASSAPVTSAPVTSAPVTTAPVTTAPVNGGSVANRLVTYNWNPSTQLTQFTAAGKGAVVEAIGDSTTLGFGSAGTNYRALSYPTDLAGDLTSAGIAAQSDNFTGLDSNYDSRVSIVGGATYAEPQVPGGYTISTGAAGDGFDFTLPTPGIYNHVSVSYIDGGQGSFTVSVDGGAPLGTVSVGNTYGTKTATFAVPLGSHNEISVRATNATRLFLDGASFSNSVSPSVSVIDAGIGGATAPSNVDSTGNPATNFGKLAGDVALAPNLVLVDYGIDDIDANVPLSQTIAAEKTIVETFKAANADPVLVIPEPVAGANFSSQIGAFRAAIDQLAIQENVGVIDLSATYGDDYTKLQALNELSGDSLHPNAAGYADIAAKIASVIGNTPSAAVSVAVAPSAPVSVVLGGSGPDTLALAVSEDAYQGDAQFTVSVDGAQYGGIQTATASHAAGASQTFDVLGNFSGSNTVAVNFLNDAYGGTPTTDRNLYVNASTIDGATIPGGSLTELSSGAQSFPFSGPASVVSTPVVATSNPVSVAPNAGAVLVGGSGPDSLALLVTEEAWQGDAQFTISVDGTQIGGTQTAVANQAVTYTVDGTFAPGLHTATVNFLNDAWGGTPSTDRNLYVQDATLDGANIPNSTVADLIGGPQSFSFTQAARAGAPVVIEMSEDAWQGDAQYTIAVDGTQIGTGTETKLHSLGQEDFVSLGTLGVGPHDIAVDFLNDAWGFTPTTDRNLYVDGVRVGGFAVPGASLTLDSSGTQHLGIVVPTN